jgi:peroxiredoxin
MLELGQLDAKHEEFAKRNTQVVAVSLDNREESLKTQEQWQHLIVVSDEKENLAKSAELIAPQRSKDGGDTLAPTTVLCDKDGVVRWVSRKDTFLERPAVEDVLKAIDDNIHAGH